jgi:hypothetical protein
MAALFFLAFAYFAVGQTSVARNSTQAAADAAALAAAREARDQMRGDFLAALTAGDTHALGDLLLKDGTDTIAACGQAGTFAADNGATLRNCQPVGSPPGFSVEVRAVAAIGRTAVHGTEDVHPTARATAVVTPRCTVGDTAGHAVKFLCQNGDMTIDPTATGFVLDLSHFYTVRLSK